MGIIYWTNKQTGITYAYNNEAYWDRNKKQSRAKRTLIGRVNPETGQIISTRAYKKKKKSASVPVKPGPIPITEFKRSFFGATYLFDEIGRMTGVTAL